MLPRIPNSPTPDCNAASLSFLVVRYSPVLADAGIALANGKPEFAEQPLRRVLAENPDLAEAQCLYGITCRMGGQAVKASDWLHKAMAQHPENANIRTYWGCTLHDSDAFDEALIHLRRACELAPGQVKPHYNLGKALKEAGQLSDAGEAIHQTLALNAQHVLARLGAADIATMQGDFPLTVAKPRHVLSQQPERAEAWHGLANLKTEALGPADADALRRALSKSHLPSDMQVMLGFACFAC